MGLGYCGPYLDRFRDEAARAFALMPAAQGRDRPGRRRAARPRRWSSATCCRCRTPASTACSSRMRWRPPNIRARSLEEVWRVLAPEGRAVFVAPSRRGVWARVDGTPFGHGQPFSRGQLRDLCATPRFRRCSGARRSTRRRSGGACSSIGGRRSSASARRSGCRSRASTSSRRSSRSTGRSARAGCAQKRLDPARAGAGADGAAATAHEAIARRGGTCFLAGANRSGGPHVRRRLLVLLRHGQSDWNLKNLFTGWKDPDLTPRPALKRPRRPAGG